MKRELLMRQPNRGPSIVRYRHGVLCCVVVVFHRILRVEVHAAPIL